MGIILLLFLPALGSRPARCETSAGSVSGSPHLSETLSRWRDIARHRREGKVVALQERDAALVMAWGQMLEHFLRPGDEEMRELLESRVKSVGFVEARLTAAVQAYDVGDRRIADSTGTFFDAYMSRLDGSGQLYVLHVPPGYAPHESYPLVIRLELDGASVRRAREQHTSVALPRHRGHMGPGRGVPGGGRCAA